jgi:hypothetical protein
MITSGLCLIVRP